MVPVISLQKGPGWLELEAGWSIMAMVRSLFSRHLLPTEVGAPAEEQYGRTNKKPNTGNASLLGRSQGPSR